MRNWVVREKIPEDVESNLTAYSPLARKLLYSRGIADPLEAGKFLNPSYERDLHDPFLSKDMERAVERILRAISDREKICVFGDYDADGIPSAALFHSFFSGIGYDNFMVYIPDRYTEDYGLSPSVIDTVKASGVSLIITVDCGIGDFIAINKGNSLGIDTIVIDHHLPHESLPDAYAIINHKQTDDNYPFKYLCAAGTAFKMIQALIKSLRAGRLSQGDRRASPSLREGEEKWLLDLVAVATVADMVPLLGENRALVYFGLKVLRKTQRPGLLSLFRQTGINQEFLSEDDIAYLIGPRINIASRMTHGVDAFNLLTTADPALAASLTAHLEERHLERRVTVEAVLQNVYASLGTEPAPVIVRGDPSWRIGVIGLSAQRLLEKYKRPVVLWTVNHAGVIKGSVRSDGTVHALKLMRQAGGSDLFLDFGGHESAGGFSMRAGREKELEGKIIEAYSTTKSNERPSERLMIDERVELGQVGWELYSQIEAFAPFGMGNPKPIFLVEQAEVVDSREFGKNGNTHLELKLKNGEKTASAISFFVGREGFPGIDLNPGSRVDLAVNLEKSYYRGRSELRLRIIDLRTVKT